MSHAKASHTKKIVTFSHNKDYSPTTTAYTALVWTLFFLVFAASYRTPSFLNRAIIPLSVQDHSAFSLANP